MGADPCASASPGYFVFILFSFTQQNRTFAFQSRCRWLPPPCPGPTSRPVQEGLPPRRPPAGRCRRWSFGKDAPGRGRTCPSLAPKQPGRPGFLWYLRKQTQPHLRQTLRCAWHCRVRFLEDGCPARLSLAAGPPWGGGLLPVGAARSLLVVIGGVGEGELQAVGLGQQQADVPVPPVGRGQVLQEEEQLLKISFF